MEDPINSEFGPDQSFDARMRNHQEELIRAGEQLEKAKKDIGQVTPQMDAYASALADKRRLETQGTWLLAAYKTLDPIQRESLARTQGAVVEGQKGNSKPSGSDLQ